MDSTPRPIRDFLAAAIARYITVRPDGIELRPGEVVPSIAARLLAFHPARTLYESRRPTCRSLDGVRAMTGGRTCDACLFRRKCTPQLCIELWTEGVPARLLLAFTSMRRFLEFVEARRKRGLPVEGADVLIAVLNRGHWGEVTFFEDGSKPSVPPVPLT